MNYDGQPSMEIYIWNEASQQKEKENGAKR